jgi:hypothetical protein
MRAQASDSPASESPASKSISQRLRAALFHDGPPQRQRGRAVSAPVTERARTAVRGRTATIPAQRGIADGPATAADPGAERAGVPGAAQALRRSAQQKAYERRDERVRRVGGGRPGRAAAPAGRPRFVLLIMVLLAVGLVATLWLSTAAAADSYRLEDATAEARMLSEQAERLHREVAVLASAPELARRATELGMTPVRDPARLVVAPDGSVDVVGEPRAAVPPQPPAPLAPPAPPGAAPPATDGTEAAVPEGTAPEGTGSAGTDTDGNGTDGNGTARLAAPGGDAAAPAVDGREPVASAEGAREDAPGGSDTEPGADQTSGQDAAGEDRSGPDRRAADGAAEAGPSTAAGRGGGGTDAG